MNNSKRVDMVKAMFPCVEGGLEGECVLTPDLAVQWIDALSLSTHHDAVIGLLRLPLRSL